MSERKVIRIRRYWENLHGKIEGAVQRKLRARVDDAVARVSAAGERIQRERRERKVVDDFVSRRQRQRKRERS